MCTANGEIIYVHTLYLDLFKTSFIYYVKVDVACVDGQIVYMGCQVPCAMKDCDSHQDITNSRAIKLLTQRHIFLYKQQVLKYL